MDSRKVAFNRLARNRRSLRASGLVGTSPSYIREVHSHLRQGGGFILDVTTEFNLLQNFAGYTFAENFENASYIWENDYDIVNKICSSKVTVFTHTDGQYKKHVEVHRQEVYPTNILLQMLNDVGFEMCGYFQDLTEKPVKRECERIHFVCKKK